jgi:phosphoglycolate phosphatase
MRGVFNDLADAHGFRRVAEGEHERFRDLHGLAMLKALGLPLWKLPRVVADMRRRMAQHTGRLDPFPGIREVLARMHQAGVQLGVVSSNSRENVERILSPETAALIRHFSCGASMFGKAGKLRRVVKASGIVPEKCLYVGDEVRDAEAARKAGIPFGAVAWGMHSENALRAERPAEFFRHVKEIADIVLGER